MRRFFLDYSIHVLPVTGINEDTLSLLNRFMSGSGWGIKASQTLHDTPHKKLI